MTLKSKKSKSGVGIVFVLSTVFLVVRADAMDILEVYQHARVHDAQYQSALLRFKGDALTLDMSRSRYKPNVTLTYRAAHNDYESDQLDVSQLDVNGCADLNCIVNRVNQLNRNGTNSTYQSQQASLLLTQTIYDASLLAENKKASAFVEKSREDLLAAEKELIMRVVSTYLKALKASDEKSLYSRQVDDLSTIKKVAEKRFHLGIGKERDLYEVQVAYDLQFMALELADAEYRMALQQLSDISGLTVSRVKTLSEEMPLDAESERTLEQWLTVARSNNNPLLAAKAFEQLSYFDMQSKKNAGLPKFNFAISYGQDDFAGGQGFSPESNVLAYGVEMKWPLYQGGGIEAGGKQAAYRLEESRERIRHLQQDIETAINGLLLAISADRRRYDSAKHLIQSATHLEIIARKAWQNGSGSIAEWFDAQKKLQQAQQGLSQVRYDYVEHIISLQRMAGELSQNELEKLNAWLVTSPLY